MKRAKVVQLMANVCTICSNENVEDINSMIIKGAKLKTISDKYPGVSYGAVQRHSRKCVLGETMAEELKKKWDAASLADEILDISLGSAREARSKEAYGAIGSILNNPTKICELLSKTTDSDKDTCGLAEMRLELKLMRGKSPQALTAPEDNPDEIHINE